MTPWCHTTAKISYLPKISDLIHSVLKSNVDNLDKLWKSFSLFDLLQSMSPLYC